LRNHFSDSLA